MASNWNAFCRKAGQAVEGNTITVELGEGRRQKVVILKNVESILLTSVVAGKAGVEALPDALLVAWKRNRATLLVGFRIDERGRLVGEAELPTACLTAEEFQLYLRAVAAEADRFEFLLTGKDRE